MKRQLLPTGLVNALDHYIEVKLAPHETPAMSTAPATQEPTKDDERIQDLAEWNRHLNVTHGVSNNWAPASGLCFSCRYDLVDHFKRTGNAHPTRCMKCSSSFCD